MRYYYQATLQAAAGHRAERDQHHHRILQSLQFTIGLDPDALDRLDKFRKKRNLGVYEAAGVVSEEEVTTITAMAEDLRARIEVWLKNEHPELMK